MKQLISLDKQIKCKPRFVLKQKKDKNLLSQIYLYATIRGERLKLYIGERIEPKYWDSTKMLAETTLIPKYLWDRHRDLNLHLSRIERYLNEYIVAYDYSEGSMKGTKTELYDFLIEKLDGVKSEKSVNPLDFFRNYVEDSFPKRINRKTGTLLETSTQGHHRVVLKRIEGYFIHARLRKSFDVFTENFGEKFRLYLMQEKKYAHNTISATFSILKIWLKEAEKKGHVKDAAFHHYPTATIDVANVYLTEDEIEKIYRLDFADEEIAKRIDPKSHIQQTRDLFVLACWTGLRFGDFKDLSKVTYKGNNMIVPTSKTKKTVMIPIHPYVKEILEKYAYSLPKLIDKSHSLNQIRKCAELAGVCNEEQISRVKAGQIVTEVAPKFKFIGHHSARRSFATNMYKRGVKVYSIMQITGHTTETNFFKYIALNPEEHADIIAAGFVD